RAGGLSVRVKTAISRSGGCQHLNPGNGGTRTHPSRARRDQLGHRGPTRRGRSLGNEKNNPPVQNAKAGPRDECFVALPCKVSFRCNLAPSQTPNDPSSSADEDWWLAAGQQNCQ